MVFKILCITLLACVVVHAAPKFDFKKDANEMFKKIGDLANETMKGKQKALKDKIDAALDFKKAALKSVVQTVDTKKAIIKEGFKFKKGMIGVFVDKDGKEDMRLPDDDAEPVPAISELKESDELYYQ